MDGLSDRWSSWLLEKRFVGDREWMTTSFKTLYAVRDRVLDNAGLNEASVMLDVGAGDGLIAFGALERLKPDARVIFSAISAALISHARDLALQLGVSNRVDFLIADACDFTTTSASWCAWPMTLAPLKFTLTSESTSSHANPCHGKRISTSRQIQTLRQ